MDNFEYETKRNKKKTARKTKCKHDEKNRNVIILHSRHFSIYTVCVTLKHCYLPFITWCVSMCTVRTRYGLKLKKKNVYDLPFWFYYHTKRTLDYGNKTWWWQKKKLNNNNNDNNSKIKTIIVYLYWVCAVCVCVHVCL